MSSHNGLLDQETDILERLTRAVGGPKFCSLDADLWGIAVQLLMNEAGRKITSLRDNIVEQHGVITKLRQVAGAVSVECHSYDDIRKEIKG